MEERTLYPGKLWPILGVASLATLALLFASTGSRDGRIGALVLLVGVLFFAVQLLPGAVYLKLTREGFEYKNVLPAKFVKWSDVDHFTTYQYKYTRYVGWVYSDLASVDSYSSFFTGGYPRPISRFLRLRIDDGFTRNFELKKADALATLLEEWRKKYDDTTWVNIPSTPQ
jgi:hypothetical protein